MNTQDIKGAKEKSDRTIWLLISAIVLAASILTSEVGTLLEYAVILATILVIVVGTIGSNAKTVFRKWPV